MALRSKKVFVASDILYSFVDRGNVHYPESSAYFRYFAQEKYHVYTGYLNVSQTYEQIYTKISPSLAKDFLRGITLSSINILYPTEQEMKAALKALINYRNTDLTFFHSQVAVLCNRNSIPQVCTFEYLHPLFGLTTFYLPI